MIIYDKDKIIEWLTEISLRPCDFSRPEDYDDNMTEDLADGALEILKGPIAARPVADWVEDSDPGELIGAHSRSATPTIDAVPVVRCKDCEMNNQCSIQFKFANADNPGDWFCADGKRKDKDA